MATKRLKRPRDPIALAKLIGDIATGQVQDRLPTDPAKEHVIRGGIKGGQARAKALSPGKRKAIAKKAAAARWKTRPVRAEEE
jgi:hypothetical protein